MYLAGVRNVEGQNHSGHTVLHEEWSFIANPKIVSVQMNFIERKLQFLCQIVHCVLNSELN